MVRRVCGAVWINRAGEYFKTVRPIGENSDVCAQCDLWASDDCISINSRSCRTKIDILVFKKITKEEAEKIMGKKKFIVRFVNHDENELVEATCSAHAAILAQSRRIEMGEDDVTVKSVEPINPYVVTVGKYTITNDNGVLSVTRNGEFWDRSLAGDGLVLALVQRIEELEKAQNNKNTLIFSIK